MPSSACSRALRTLPSFPTRRSSDLPPVPNVGRCGHRGCRRTDRRRGGRRNRRRRCRRRRRWPWRGCRSTPPRSSAERRRVAGVAAWRSEEHTSELQSRGHLVCRLLLAPAPSAPSPLSLHDALPICHQYPTSADAVTEGAEEQTAEGAGGETDAVDAEGGDGGHGGVVGVLRLGHRLSAGGLRGSLRGDRKSTRLNSSHVAISYAVFCLLPRPPHPPLFPYTTLFRSATSTQRRPMRSPRVPKNRPPKGRAAKPTP